MLIGICRVYGLGFKFGGLGQMFGTQVWGLGLQVQGNPLGGPPTL